MALYESYVHILKLLLTVVAAGIEERVLSNLLHACVK
jgi:hypothetical protein